jgi:hypothetical protein
MLFVSPACAIDGPGVFFEGCVVVLKKTSSRREFQIAAINRTGVVFEGFVIFLGMTIGRRGFRVVVTKRTGAAAARIKAVLESFFVRRKKLKRWFLLFATSQRIKKIGSRLVSPECRARLGGPCCR